MTNPTPGKTASQPSEFALLLEAIRVLPELCREVVTLRKLHGLSHREIALRLGIPESTVGAQLAIGVMRCRNYLESRGVAKRGGDVTRKP